MAYPVKERKLDKTPKVARPETPSFLSAISEQVGKQAKRFDKAYQDYGIPGVVGRIGKEIGSGWDKLSETVYGADKTLTNKIAPAVLGAKGVPAVKQVLGDPSEPTPASAPTPDPSGVAMKDAMPDTYLDQGMQYKQTQYSDIDKDRYTVPSGSYAGSNPSGKGTFSTMPAFNAELAKKQADNALMQKWLSIPQNQRGRMPSNIRELFGKGPEPVRTPAPRITSQWEREKNLRNAQVGMDTTSRRHESESARKSREASNAVRLANVARLQGQYEGEDQRQAAVDIARIERPQGGQSRDPIEAARVKSQLDMDRDVASEQRATQAASIKAEREERAAVFASQPEAQSAFKRWSSKLGEARAQELLNEAMGYPDILEGIAAVEGRG